MTNSNPVTEQTVWTERASKLLSGGSINAAYSLAYAASGIANEHREYVCKYHKGKFTTDDNDIIQHWENVAFTMLQLARKLANLKV